MATIEQATTDDVATIVDMMAALFGEDAGVHDRFANIDWPRQHGESDVRDFLADPSRLVLVARDTGDNVAMLMAYTTPTGPTRLPATVAVLRDLYVRGTHRRQGIGNALIAQFVMWAREAGCDEATVDCYAANIGARHLYESHGFAPQSIHHVAPL